MAFKRNVSDTIRVNVTVNVPNERGTTDKNTFMGIFKRPKSAEEMDELRNTPFTDMVRKQLVDWEMTDAETKEAVPFSAQELDRILGIEPTPRATAMAFFDAMNGVRAKNF